MRTNALPKRGRERKSINEANQRALIWRRLRTHRIAMIALIVLGLLYLGATLCEFWSPFLPNQRFPELKSMPPQRIRIWDGKRLRLPFVYGLSSELDPETFQRVPTTIREESYPVRLFARGEPYKLWGAIPSRVHFIASEGPLFLLGTDNLGRDVFSRVLYGSRVSLTIGLVGIAITFVLGLVLGGVSGYFGGFIDEIIQRIIDVVVVIPGIPLWMMLAAALPRDWPPIRVYFAITVITSLINWTGLARVVRGKMLSLRQEKFVVAARLSGASSAYLIRKHMLPLFSSYIIVALTMSIPATIIGETSLSFLGLGLQPPVVSWGVLLQGAQNLQSIAGQPWLLTPAIWVIVTVIMFNFLGDGLRDAADPYKMEGET